MSVFLAKQLDKIRVNFYFHFSVRKSAKAKNIETQLEMLTKDNFNIVYGSEKHMKKQLLDDGFVFSLQYPGHKWRFLAGGNYEIFYHG